LNFFFALDSFFFPFVVTNAVYRHFTLYSDLFAMLVEHGVEEKWQGIWRDYEE
jgi:hypothetical protein